MKPIAITGKFRSGKDTVAAHLVERYGYTRFAFGDELKRDFHERYPEIPEEPKPRAGYQSHGQLMRTFVNENVWIDRCFEKIEQGRFYHDVFPWWFEDKPFLPVISDLRQPNEFDRCRAEGYVIIRVTRPDSGRLASAAATDNFDSAAVTHETESYVDGFAVDYEIINDGTVVDLERKVDELMARLTK